MRVGGGEHDGVAIGCRACDELRTNHAAGTGPVVHHHRLLEPLAQLAGQGAGNDIGRAARWIGYDHLDGFIRVGSQCQDTRCTQGQPAGEFEDFRKQTTHDLSPCDLVARLDATVRAGLQRMQSNVPCTFAAKSV